LREFPVLDKVSKKFGANKLAVLTINSDIREGGMRKVLAKVDTALPVLRDKESKVVMAYRAFVAPTIYLIDQQGAIYSSWVGPVNDLEDRLTDGVSFVLKFHSSSQASAESAP
jgi:hypothetical protein